MDLIIWLLKNNEKINYLKKIWDTEVGKYIRAVGLFFLGQMIQ